MIDRMDQAELARQALDKLAHQLQASGIEADVIAAAALGWSVAISIEVANCSDVADTLRRSAEIADGYAIPVAGSA